MSGEPKGLRVTEVAMVVSATVLTTTGLLMLGIPGALILGGIACAIVFLAKPE